MTAVPTPEDRIGRLAEAAVALRPLAGALGRPLRIAAPAGAAALLGAVAAGAGLPPFVVDPDVADPFDRVATDHLNRHGLGDPTGLDLATVEAVAAAVASRSFDALYDVREVPSPDGGIVRAYAAGSPDAPPLLIAAAVGMPARLCEGWLRELSDVRYVVLWESRGLFPAPADGDTSQDGALDLAAQARDLFAVMDGFGIEQADVMGLCGGAVIALAAANQAPDRVRSLSLWHGDYDLGPEIPQTLFQRNLKAFLAMGGKSRTAAAGVLAAVARSNFSSAPAELAHLVLYPYTSVEALFRYCRLNAATMTADIAALLPAVTQPTLVVTSETDSTAHPAGSHHVADRLPDARLFVGDHGDHVNAFGAPPQLVAVARDFLASLITEPVR